MKNKGEASLVPTINFDGARLVVDVGFKPWDCVVFCSVVALIGSFLALLFSCVGTLVIMENFREFVTLKGIAKMLFVVLFFTEDVCSQCL